MTSDHKKFQFQFCVWEMFHLYMSPVYVICVCHLHMSSVYVICVCHLYMSSVYVICVMPSLFLLSIITPSLSTCLHVYNIYAVTPASPHQECVIVTCRLSYMYMYIKPIRSYSNYISTASKSEAL